MSFEEFFERVRRELHRLLREFREELEEDKPMWDINGRIEPLVSIQEQHDKYIVLVDLPYADLKALSVNIRGRKISIECRLSSSLRFSNLVVYRETEFNRYYTELEVPEDADVNKANIVKDEVKKMLKIIIPKKSVW